MKLVSSFELSRRAFLKKVGVVGGVTLAIGPRLFGANETIRMAVVGCGGRSHAHIAEFGKLPGVRIVAVCDPDQERLGAAAKSIATKFNYQPDTVVDVRRLLERKDIDAISVATMQYWHSLPTIWACETGRQVYVEKPLSHFIWEGRQMVNAAHKYGRLVQVGTQSRSIKGYAELARWLKAGNLGKIQYVTCFANKPRHSIGKRTEPLPIPETVNYELWCGPARKEPIYRDKLQYDCSFIWNTGDGESCNQGIHEIDIARWMLGYTGLPRRTMSIGGRFVFNDAGNVPNTQIIFYDYPDVPILYEVHNLPKSREFMTPEKWNTVPDFKGLKVGVCVQCEGGYSLGTSVFDSSGKKIQAFTEHENHFENFIKAVRSGKREDLNAEIHEGQISTSICHAGNISYRLGRRASVKKQRKQVGDIACWREMHERYVKYLGDIGVDPDTSTLGPWLECDADRERIKGNSKANRLVKGFYRKQFEVPAITL
jgi:predicted dehydrogenase